MQDISNYEKIREDGQNFYKQIGAFRCPALNNELVHFTAEGFNHLIYKGKRHERSKNDQITKIKLLSKVIVRQVGNGQKHFWSVIPAWTTNHYRDIKLIIKAKGNLAED